ncbi:splicing regulator SDE2-like [Uloborus diversus]|uniref:splicing regulator SDE2-like n=1 Tax=Uloborus diversus TaxID=327109 RepID=UPI00240A9365|nr:splicing regulator SDE2-like [Uloborus diversus]
MVFLRFPYIPGYKCQNVFTDCINYHDLQDSVLSYTADSDYKLYYNGKKLLQTDALHKDAVIHVVLSLPGGKGGFGSMLRAIGAQIEKTTNREACRDLSGRRLRDINEEERIRKWLAKKAEREAEKMRRRKERLERLKSKPKHNFVDFEFEKEISQLPERIDDALTEGLEKSSKNPPEKRALSDAACSSKKKRLWIEDEVSTESSSSDSEVQETVSLDDSDTVSSLDSSNQNSSAGCSESKSMSVISSKKATEANSNPCMIESKRSHGDSKDGECSTGSSSSSDATGSETCIKSEEQFVDSEEGNDKSMKIEIKEGKMEIEIEVKSESNDAATDQKTLCKDNEIKNDSSIDLLDFECASELEALGLDRLKSALMARGLKCGGTISDRADRLWKVRGLQPHEYPSNLLAKGKK